MQALFAPLRCVYFVADQVLSFGHAYSHDDLRGVVNRVKGARDSYR